MAKKVAAKESVAAPRQKPSALLDTRVVYCGDNLEQLAKLPDACVDLIYPATAGRPRCVQLARVLKQTGSFYYNCDWNANVADI
jgi:DNA modification methylase